MSNMTPEATMATPNAAEPVSPVLPEATLPLEQLSDRELIARAEFCEQLAHTADPAGRAAALDELDAAWEEAERRAAGQAPLSVPAQVAGYIGLVREDDDHTLAAEAATWRRQLDAALPPIEPVPDRGAGDQGAEPTAAADWHHEDRVLRDHLADEAALAGRYGTDGDEPSGETQPRWWPATGVRTQLAAHQATQRDAELDTVLDPQGERRREQLARWYDDDHNPYREATRGGLDTDDAGDSWAGGASAAGWAR